MRTFPRSGYASLRAQIVASAESIACNIVEGCGSYSQKDFARFIEIAIKSTSELEYQIQIVIDSGIGHTKEWNELAGEVVEIRRMLCGLRKAILAAANRPTPQKPRRSS